MDILLLIDAGIARMAAQELRRRNLKPVIVSRQPERPTLIRWGLSMSEVGHVTLVLIANCLGFFLLALAMPKHLAQVLAKAGLTQARCQFPENSRTGCCRPHLGRLVSESVNPRAAICSAPQGVFVGRDGSCALTESIPRAEQAR